MRSDEFPAGWDHEWRDGKVHSAQCGDRFGSVFISREQDVYYAYMRFETKLGDGCKGFEKFEEFSLRVAQAREIVNRLNGEAQ